MTYKPLSRGRKQIFPNLNNDEYRYKIRYRIKEKESRRKKKE